MMSAFGRAPGPAFFQRPVSAIYIAGDYDGAAIVVPTPLGPYLSKFAVDRRAQGEGIGGHLWRAMEADHPSLFWRARDTNPISAWYAQRCDGLVRTAGWALPLYQAGSGTGAPPQRHRESLPDAGCGR